jgi:hypothetical protein
MCDECRQHPCHPRCPNAPDPPIKEIGECAEESCGELITDDYLYYKDNENNVFCSSDCAMKYYGIEEIG